MADDVKDIAIYDGNKWQSLSALAAEAVEPELPISSADDTVVLDSPSANTFKISTGGEERVFVKPASYGSGAVTIGKDHTHSIGGVSIKNDPAQVNYAAQMQMRFVDENGKYAYMGCTEPRFAIGGDNALVDGGVFFAGHDNGNAVLFSKTADVIIATGGLAANSERLRITDAAAIFDGDIRTSKLVGLAHSTDASIELGADFVVQAGGKNKFRSTERNCIRTLQVGSASEPALAFSDTTTGFFFAPDDSGNYNTNESGIAFTIANANSGVAEREILRFKRTGQVVVADDYTPTQPNSLATKAYADTKAELWTGSQVEYDQLGIYNNQTLYCITD